MVLVAVAGACGNIHTVVLSEDKQSLVCTCTESDSGGTVGTGGREGTSDDQYRATRSRIRRDKKIYPGTVIVHERLEKTKKSKFIF